MDGCARRALRCFCRPLGFLVALATIGLCSVFYVFSHVEEHHPSSGSLLKKRKGKSKIHVCLCSDDTDLRPAAVAIKSTYDSAAEPDRLVFHFITAAEFAPLFQELFSTYLPEVRVEVHHDSLLQEKIDSFITLRDKTKSKTRHVLASPFNFAGFYLHDFLDEKSSGKKFNTKRLIYIDTDVVVLGDVGELHAMPLRGHPVAAVDYCQQHFEDYMDMDSIEQLSGEKYDPKRCIANRGIMVIDTVRWKQRDLTGKIEEWMLRYRTAARPPWIGGLSQPPWLLAMNGDYLRLDQEWNCNGLGRDIMSIQESQALKEAGFDRYSLKQLDGKVSKKHGQISPYVITCSKMGKMLHFNGAMKPWDLDRDDEESMKLAPSCSMPTLMPWASWGWTAVIRLLCEGLNFVRCADIWSVYITDEAACALKDFEKDWRADEAAWETRRQDQQWGQQQALLEAERKKRATERQAAFEDLQSHLNAAVPAAGAEEGQQAPAMSNAEPAIMR